MSVPKALVVPLVFCLGVGGAPGSPSQGKERPEHPAVSVDYYGADWCHPCQKLKPVLLELEKEYRGRVTFRFTDTDKEKTDEVDTEKLGIPVTVLKTFGTEYARFIGFVNKKALKAVIESEIWRDRNSSPDADSSLPTPSPCAQGLG